MNDFRTDGLLRGSREERMKQAGAVANSDWSLDTILNLHVALLDHAEPVREEAMESLLELARRKPEPCTINPVQMISRFIMDFTQASGMSLYAVRTLAELGTEEARQELLRVVELSGMSNNLYELCVEVIQASPSRDLLQQVHLEKLGQKKIAAIKQAISKSADESR